MCGRALQHPIGGTPAAAAAPVAGGGSEGGGAKGGRALEAHTSWWRATGNGTAAQGMRSAQSCDFAELLLKLPSQRREPGMSGEKSFQFCLSAQLKHKLLF